MRTRNYGAVIEPREPSCGSRKKTSSSGDLIRRSDQRGQGAGNTSSRDSRRSDKSSVKGDLKGPIIVQSESKSSSSSSSSTSTATSEKHKRRKSRRKHRQRDSGPCCCPMYEVEVIKAAGAEALRGKQRTQPGMKGVATETATKRLYAHNMDIGLPEGVRISPRGKFVEDEGVSAENGAYDMLQPNGARPTYQSPYGQGYSQPQRPQLAYSPRDQMGAPAERYMQIQQQKTSTNGGRAAMMQVSSYEMLPRREASPPLMSQNLSGQMQIIRPQKVDSLVFQCLCGHDRGKRKSTTTTTTTTFTSSTTSPPNTSTKTTKTSSSSRKKGRKSSTSSTSTKTSQKKGSKSSTSSTSTKTSQKKGNKSSTSSTSTKTSEKNKEMKSSTSSSGSSSSTTSTSTSAKLKKKQCESGFVQVQILCDRCGQRKTYLVCVECYNLHKITTCKDCKGAALREYSGYPSQNALVRVAGQMMAYRPALPPPSPPPQTYQPLQPQQPLQLYGGDDIVGALSNANAALIVCCSSNAMLPLSNAGVYQDTGAAYGQRPITTNVVLGIVNPNDIKKNPSPSSSTTTTTPSSRTSVKSKCKSGTRSTNTGDENRGSSLCKCGHDSRTCAVCYERKHML